MKSTELGISWSYKCNTKITLYPYYRAYTSIVKKLFIDKLIFSKTRTDIIGYHTSPETF